MIETERLIIYPASQDQVTDYIEKQTVDNCKSAYIQLLNDALKHFEYCDKYGMWMIDLKNNKHIGELFINSLSSEGIIEIGCSIDYIFEDQGYVCEAVTAFAEWVFNQSYSSFSSVANDRAKAFKAIFNKCAFISIGSHKELVFRFVLKLNDEGCVEHVMTSLSLYEVFKILEDKYGYDFECEFDELCNNDNDEMLEYLNDRMNSFKVWAEKKNFYDALDIVAQTMFISLTDKYGEGWNLHHLLNSYPDDDLPKAFDSYLDYLDRISDLFSRLIELGYKLDDI